MMSTFSGWTDDAPGLVEPLEKNIMATSCLASLLDSLYLFNMSVCGGDPYNLEDSYYNYNDLGDPGETRVGSILVLIIKSQPFFSKEEARSDGIIIMLNSQLWNGPFS